MLSNATVRVRGVAIVVRHNSMLAAHFRVRTARIVLISARVIPVHVYPGSWEDCVRRTSMNAPPLRVSGVILWDAPIWLMVSFARVSMGIRATVARQILMNVPHSRVRTLRSVVSIESTGISLDCLSGVGFS